MVKKEGGFLNSERGAEIWHSTNNGKDQQQNNASQHSGKVARPLNGDRGQVR